MRQESKELGEGLKQGLQNKTGKGSHTTVFVYKQSRGLCMTFPWRIKTDNKNKSAFLLMKDVSMCLRDGRRYSFYFTLSVTF